jgi:acetolactate synthase-1/2/3 large subunit
MSYQVLAADSYLEGDIAASLRTLTQAAKNAVLDSDLIAERKIRWTKEHQTFVGALRAKEQASCALDGIDMRSLCAALNEWMPGDVIYVDEAVTNTVIAIQHLNWIQPQSYFKAVYGLGQGIGIALGLKLAAPTRPVVLLSGDGSFLYNPVLAGFGASRGKSLPLLMIVLNNGQYAAMKQGHVHHYPNGEAIRSNNFYGVAIDGPAYEELGREFGFHGRRVERVEDLVAALGEALAAVQQGRSAILNVILRP